VITCLRSLFGHFIVIVLTYERVVHKISTVYLLLDNYEVYSGPFGTISTISRQLSIISSSSWQRVPSHPQRLFRFGKQMTVRRGQIKTACMAYGLDIPSKPIQKFSCGRAFPGGLETRENRVIGKQSRERGSVRFLRNTRVKMCADALNNSVGDSPTVARHILFIRPNNPCLWVPVAFSPRVRWNRIKPRETRDSVTV